MTKPWVGTDPLRPKVNTAATRCDDADFMDPAIPYATTRSFLVPQAKLPSAFGLTETLGAFRSSSAAGKFVDGVRTKMDRCEDKDPGTTVARTTDRSTKGEDLTLWKVTTEISDKKSVSYLMAIGRRDNVVVQVGFVPVPGHTLGNAAFTRSRRAGPRPDREPAEPVARRAQPDRPPARTPRDNAHEAHGCTGDRGLRMTEDEFDEFYTASFARVTGQVYAMIGNRDEAQECVQEAFVRAWAHRRKLERSEHPEAWVRTTAYRLAVSRWRRTSRSRRAPDRAMSPPTRTAPPSEDHVALVAALRLLPEAQRRALVLHHVCDLPVQAVAAEVGVPEGTVKARLSRGRAALAALLSVEIGDDPGTLPEGARHV